MASIFECYVLLLSPKPVIPKISIWLKKKENKKKEWTEEKIQTLIQMYRNISPGSWRSLLFERKLFVTPKCTSYLFGNSRMFFQTAEY